MVGYAVGEMVLGSTEDLDPNKKLLGVNLGQRRVAMRLSQHGYIPGTQSCS